METLKKEVISLPEVKEILAKVEIEEMDQIQRWTFDYVSKFAKMSSENSRAIINELVRTCDLKEEEAVEIVNSMPSSVEELRAFTFGWKKLILTDTLNRILDILNRKFYKLKGREGKSEHECLCDFYGERKVECLLINEERKLHKNKEGSLDVHKSKGERKLG